MPLLQASRLLQLAVTTTQKQCSRTEKTATAPSENKENISSKTTMTSNYLQTTALSVDQ